MASPPAADGHDPELEATLEAWRADYDRDGFVIAGGVVPRADLEPIKADLERLTHAVALKRGLQAPPSAPMGFADAVARYEDSDTGFAAALHEEMELTPAVAQLWGHQRLLRAVAALTGWEAIAAHPIFNIRPKAPSGKELNYGMHQDPAFWNERALGVGVVACWLPLVDVGRANGTLQLIRGSHQRRRLFPHRLAPDGSYAPFIPRGQLPQGECVLAEISPGDAVFFQEYTVHGGCGPNKTRGVRWAVDLRWQSHHDPNFLTGQHDTVKLWDSAAGAATVDVPSWAASWRRQELARKAGAAWKELWPPTPAAASL